MKILKTSQLALCVSFTALFTAGCANSGTEAISINEQSSELEKVGYSYGYVMAMNNKEVIDDLNLEAFNAGFKDAYTDQEAALTDEEIEKVLKAYEQKKIAELQEKAMAERQQLANKNLAVADEFLASNSTKEGVKTTDTGLQYKVLTQGTGATPTIDDNVLVHYEGKLLDGTIFDSSYQRDEPQNFVLRDMVPGFTEGVLLMQEGAKYELYLPPALAYGEAGNRGIEPNTMLIFTVELLDVNP